jgi:hypothetical protein
MSPTERRATRLVAPLLVAATVVTFAPTLENGFVAWDDGRNLTANPHWRGLGLAHLAWIATASHGGHYMPLTWLTYALDYRLWGLNPVGYHLTSLVLHAVAVVLCYAVARGLIRRAVTVPLACERAGAAVAALVFGLHPLRVESVAWATERRDVLSGALFLAVVWLYLGAVQSAGTRRRRYLLASVTVHAAAVLSKSMAASAPAVLLLLDVYPLRRVAPDPRRWSGREWGVLLREKAPYVVVSVVALVLAFRAQMLDRGLRLVTPWADRLANVAFSLWFYPVKTLAPVGLSPLYEAPERIDPFEARFVLAGGGVLLVTLVAGLLARRYPAVPATWLYFGITIAPVSGILPLGEVLAADRYSYIPCLGFAVLAGGAVAAALPRLSRAGLAATVSLVAVSVIGLAVLAGQQTRVWRDTLSLWAHAVEATPECALCHANLGHSLLERGAPEAALPHFLDAVILRPHRSGTYRGLGRALEALGNPDEAIAWYRFGLAQIPTALSLGIDLATALVAQGRLTEATAALASPARFYPAGELVTYFESAVAARPTAPVPRLGLVRARLAAGDRERAREAYEGLRQLHPGLGALVAPTITGEAKGS